MIRGLLRKAAQEVQAAQEGAPHPVASPQGKLPGTEHGGLLGLLTGTGKHCTSYGFPARGSCCEQPVKSGWSA